MTLKISKDSILLHGAVNVFYVSTVTHKIPVMEQNKKVLSGLWRSILTGF